jgi:hypothetical protein
LAIAVKHPNIDTGIFSLTTPASATRDCCGKPCSKERQLVTRVRP